MRSLILILLALLCAAPARADAPLHAILRAEDSRNGTALEPFVRHPDPKVRARAIRAIGRLQDPAYLGTLVTAARRDVPPVRVEAIFALGQLDQPFVEASLVALLGDTAAPHERRLVVRSLGRVSRGDGEGHRRIVALLADPDPAMREVAALALEDLAWRLRRAAPAWTPPSLDVHALLPLLAEGQPAAVRAAAAGAMWRLSWLPAGQTRHRAPWAEEALGALLPLCSASDADVRMRAFQAIGETAAPDRLPAMVERLGPDGDWRVRVTRVEAIGRSAPAGAVWWGGLRLGLHDHHPLVVLSSIRAIESLSRRQGLSPGGDVYALFIDASQPVQIRAEALRVALTFHDFGESVARRAGTADASLSSALDACGPEWREHWRLRRAAAEGGGAALAGAVRNLPAGRLYARYRRDLRPYLGDGDGRVRCAAVEALGGLLEARRDATKSDAGATGDAAPDERIFDAMRADLLERLTDDDTVVCAVAADAAATLGCSRAVPAILRTLASLQPSKDIEVMESMIDALGRLQDPQALPLLGKLSLQAPETLARSAAKAIEAISGRNPPFPKRPAGTLAVPDEALALADKAAVGHDADLRAVIHTARGDIIVALCPNEAPLTVYSFIHLARSHYFDGLTFHRVVPNFVAQGGDPRGDGWGGPGYTIRCEYNPLRYVRGAVGMALAGKDTGGSQFFITHSPQPRLDGRYTIFGQVIEGLDVLDKLTEGDVMRVEIAAP